MLYVFIFIVTVYLAKKKKTFVNLSNLVVNIWETIAFSIMQYLWDGKLGRWEWKIKEVGAIYVIQFTRQEARVEWKRREVGGVKKSRGDDGNKGKKKRDHATARSNYYFKRCARISATDISFFLFKIYVSVACAPLPLALRRRWFVIYHAT